MPRSFVPSVLFFVASAIVAACSAGSQDLGSNDPDAGRGATTRDDASTARATPDGDVDAPSDGSADAEPPGQPDRKPSSDPKRVFVTSSEYTGDLGGLVGADEKCQAAADSVSLGGAWAAWLSTSTVDAIDRIEGGGPWVLVDRKTKVFNNRTNLLTTSLRAIDRDERGKSVPLARAWAGTDHGRATADTCSNWTSSEFSTLDFGTTVDGMDWNMSMNPAGCSEQNPIVCFER